MSMQLVIKTLSGVDRKMYKWHIFILKKYVYFDKELSNAANQALNLCYKLILSSWVSTILMC